MIILPAIDIKGGECVRLVKGDYSTAQKVIESPYLAAQRFADAGANWMHMVDLDGAKDAKLVNADLIADVAKSSGLSVEVGGGIRDMKAVEYYLSHGINRVILGSAAVKDQQFVIDAVNTFGDQIVIGIDAKDGMVRAEGWLDNSDINYIELAKRMEDVGVKTIVFTGIMCTSSAIVALLSFIPMPVTITKAIVDILLWTVNYTLQRKWVFNSKKQTLPYRGDKYADKNR